MSLPGANGLGNLTTNQLLTIFSWLPQSPLKSTQDNSAGNESQLPVSMNSVVKDLSRNVVKMMMVVRRRMRMTKVFPGVPRRPAATEVVQVHGQDVKVCVLPFFHRDQ